MQNWPDTNPYSALLPYLDERAWLLPEILARRERRRPGPAGRPGAAEIRRFLAATGRPLAADALRRLRTGPAPPETLWHVAVRRRGASLCGECLPGAPAGAGPAFRAQALQALARGEAALVVEGRPAALPAVYWIRAAGLRRSAGLELAADRGGAARPWVPVAGPDGEGADARWTGTYFDRALATPPPRWVLEEAARFVHALASAPPRGCAVLVHDSGRVRRGTYCPGLPPDTGSRFTRRVRETIAEYDRAESLPALCVDREARGTAIALVEWRCAPR